MVLQMLCVEDKGETMRLPCRKISRALTHPGVTPPLSIPQPSGKQQAMGGAGSRLDSCSECDTLRDDCLPKFRIPMQMLQKTGNTTARIRVVLSIYSTNFDLYAVVSQDRNIIVKDCGYIKLKHCLVTIHTKELILEIIQKKYEGVSLRFKVNKREHLDMISSLLHLNTDCDSTSVSCTDLSCSPLSYSPIHSVTHRDTLTSRDSVTTHPALSKLRAPAFGAPTTRSPRASPLERRKLSMPVLAEDRESESESEEGSIPEEEEGEVEEDGFESEE